jgi:N-acetylglucosaminyldiphosphoundecaprenol N-acetyl-beta-D-mannosaminyltransferase
MKTAEAVSPTENGLPETISILGVQVHNVTTEETLAYMRRYMDEPSLHQIATVNPEFVMTAQNNATFRQVLNNSDLCLPDGIGLLFAGRWLGHPLKERVAGSDLVYALASEAARHGWRLFLLGAAPGVADQVAEIFSAEHPNIQIAGTFPGSPSLEENDDLVQRINQSNADLLFVAYGAPAQDLWISRNRNSLENVRVAIGVGGSLDFITGRAVRAPKWIQQIGLEWFYRLLREPWRWKRMLALPRFTLRVLLSKA